MTCDSLPGGLFFQFEQSGLAIEPEEVDYRSNKEDFAHCQFIVPEYIGDRIAENYKAAEPVNMIIDGHRSHRFYAPADMISYRRQMDKPTRAKIDLLDAQQVLQRGTIEKTWDTATFGEIVDYIFTNRDDPYGVLDEYKFFVEEDVVEQQFGDEDLALDPGRLASELTGGFVPDPSEVIENTFTRPTLDFVASNVEQLEPVSDARYVEPSFEGVSPAEALNRAAQTMNQWVRADDSGTLLIGDFGGLPVTHVIDDSNGIALSRYDVVSASNMTNAVRIIGGSSNRYLKQIDAEQRQQGGRLRPVAEASVPSISGSAIEVSSEDSQAVRKMQKISTMRSAAVRLLLSELTSDAGGSLVINGMASNNKESLAKMEVGNQLAVNPIIQQLCEDLLTTGYFLIKRVQHTLNKRRGWKTTVEVSQTAQPEQIDTNVFWYDPRTEQTFDSLKSFNEYREPDPIEVDFPDLSNLI